MFLDRNVDDTDYNGLYGFCLKRTDAADFPNKKNRLTLDSQRHLHFYKVEQNQY
jgi:hypothetical protein